MSELTMTDIVVWYYPDDLNEEQIDNIEDAIKCALDDPNSPQACHLRWQLVCVVVNDKEVSYEYILESAMIFCDGWENAMKYITEAKYA